MKNVTIRTSEEAVIADIINMAVSEGRVLSDVEKALCEELALQSQASKAISECVSTIESGFWDRPVSSAADEAIRILEDAWDSWTGK